MTEEERLARALEKIQAECNMKDWNTIIDIYNIATEALANASCRLAASPCPYLYTAPDDGEGGGGTSHCRLAASHEPVSLGNCAASAYAEFNKKDSSLFKIAKAVLEAARVNYVE